MFLEKFTPQAKILHCHRQWQHGQISPLSSHRNFLDNLETTWEIHWHKLCKYFGPSTASWGLHENLLFCNWALSYLRLLMLQIGIQGYLKKICPKYIFSTMIVKRLKTYSNFEDLKSWLNKVERKTDVITTDLSSQQHCSVFLF